MNRKDRTAAIIAGTTAHAAIARDLALGGTAFVDGEGNRVDPESVVIRPATHGKSEVVSAIADALIDQKSSFDFPDRLSMDRRSPYFSAATSHIGIRLDGVEMTQAVEYCITGRWVRIADARPGEKLSQDQVTGAKRRYGTVEVFWRREPNRQIRRQLQRSR